MITRIVSRIAAILASTAAILTVMAITPVHADSGSVSVSVTVAEVISVNQGGTTYSNASERPLIVTFPATFDGVEYQITMVS